MMSDEKRDPITRRQLFKGAAAASALALLYKANVQRMVVVGLVFLRGIEPHRDSKLV